MSESTATSPPRSITLSAAQVRHYHDRGYLCPLPVVPAGETGRLERLFRRLRALLPAAAATQQMDWWHVFDRELYELCTDAAILDPVEALLGPDFYLWGTRSPPRSHPLKRRTETRAPLDSVFCYSEVANSLAIPALRLDSAGYRRQ